MTDLITEIEADEPWPDTVLARTIYSHFTDFEGLDACEAADSAGALLYALKMIGVTGDADTRAVGTQRSEVSPENPIQQGAGK
jgi:hypothetical protein